MSVNVNIPMLEKIHGKERAEGVFREIVDLGGFGNSSDGSSRHPGGLDLQGVLDESNTSIGTRAKDRMAELAGVDRKASDTFKTTSSADKMTKGDK